MNLQANPTVNPGRPWENKRNNPLQLRVVFHCERLFFGRPKVHAAYIAAVRALGYDATTPGSWSDAQCVELMELIEWVCSEFKEMRMIDCRTGWQDIHARMQRGLPPIIGMLTEGERK